MGEWQCRCVAYVLSAIGVMGAAGSYAQDNLLLGGIDPAMRELLAQERNRLRPHSAPAAEPAPAVDPAYAMLVAAGRDDDGGYGTLQTDANGTRFEGFRFGRSRDDLSQFAATLSYANGFNLGEVEGQKVCLRFGRRGFVLSFNAEGCKARWK